MQRLPTLTAGLLAAVTLAHLAGCTATRMLSAEHAFRLSGPMMRSTYYLFPDGTAGHDMFSDVLRDSVDGREWMTGTWTTAGDAFIVTLDDGEIVTLQPDPSNPSDPPLYAVTLQRPSAGADHAGARWWPHYRVR